MSNPTGDALQEEISALKQENKRLRENIGIIGRIVYHAGDHEKCAICKMVKEAEKESSKKTKIDA